MKLSRRKNKDTSTLVLDGELTIYNVSQLKNELFSGWESLAENIEFDLREVSEIDTAGVQLLMFAQIFFSGIHKTVVIAHSNPLVDGVLDSLNVHERFLSG